ncbi:amidohydrolase/deacetylase family metallohydrolase [Daejeonella sp. JGW-45]|uniref:amidohydrolase/deacetylase family metallohydrolase n=1 Tax=Daejeonella sp. JGW-45 TaxID=3034148 RepID=UPI0023EB6F35|nr:amidohydrolase/deacetylase family metallohydrolase [Daejeonella sp. JGW-45]
MNSMNDVRKIVKEPSAILRPFAVSLAAFLFLVPMLVHAQEFDLLIKNGQVIDTKNGIDSKMDIAIRGGKIAKISKDISAGQSAKVIDAKGYLVTPGLINIHTHVFVGSKPNTFADGVLSVSPDDFSFRSGITTVVDAGTSGWRNFPQFKKQVIDQSKTRILSFLNIFGAGLTGEWPALTGFPGIDDIDAASMSDMIREYPGLIVGIVIGHYHGKEWIPFDKGIQVANDRKVPILVECLLPELPYEKILERLRPGDIVTHAYQDVAARKPVPNDKRKTLVDEKGSVQPFILEARNKGVLFDVGHGGAGFWFSQAIPAVKQGFLPDSFGMDLHRFSMNSGMKDMLDIMSKFLAMGMSVNDIIARATWLPAKSIQQFGLGHLSEGAVADIAILNIEKGNFGFIDSAGFKLGGDQKFQAVLTIRDGKVVWDLNGIAAREYGKAR